MPQASKREVTKSLPRKRTTIEGICPSCKQRGPHKRSCPLNPFNKEGRRFDVDGIYEIQDLDSSDKAASGKGSKSGRKLPGLQK